MSEHDNMSEASHLEKAANVRISMNMTPREAFNFILRLSSDDEFRSRLERNPHEVLAEHHIDFFPIKGGRSISNSIASSTRVSIGSWLSC